MSKIVFSVADYTVDTPAHGGVTIYPARENERILTVKEYRFEESYLLIFGADGALHEAGGHLYPNPDGKLGSPQLTVRVPAGGFAVAFGAEADKNLHEAHAFAMEDAMLYNAMMVIDRAVDGRFDGQTLTVSYDTEVQTNPFALRFLFVGNSCIYFNGVPLKFRAICRAAGIAVDVTYCTVGGAFLYQYADPSHKCFRKLSDVLRDKKYDFAVLQDAGDATEADTENALREILPRVRQTGARPYLYMRYAPTAEPVRQKSESERLSQAYRYVGRKLGMPVAPVAEAYMRCIETYPEIDLYADDRSHLSAAGSYLAACCMAECYLRIDTRGLPYDAYLGADIAAKLQEIAHLCNR